VSLWIFEFLLRITKMDIWKADLSGVLVTYGHVTNYSQSCLIIYYLGFCELVIPEGFAWVFSLPILSWDCSGVLTIPTVSYEWLAWVEDPFPIWLWQETSVSHHMDLSTETLQQHISWFPSVSDSRERTERTYSCKSHTVKSAIFY
jgi:hypothetical protein